MRRAERRKYHYIYKTTCIINGHYYIGMHSTDNLEDGYIGSGKRLWHSINKYGKDKHKVEILEFLSTRNELKEREAQLVNEDMITDESCMNLKPGGYGGFCNEDHAKKFHKAGGRKVLQNFSKINTHRLKNDPEFRAKWMKSLMDGSHIGNWKGKKHKPESKEKIGKANSVSQLGIKNSQYGTCWIYHLDMRVCKKIKAVELEHYLNLGWTKGRKMKFS